jgi:hypothetical protein
MHRVAFVVSLIAFIGSAWANDTPLNVKTGLWETTTTVNTTGTPPIPPEALANMTPQQQAMMQERMKSMAAQNAVPRTRRECLTQQDIDDAFKKADQNPNCTRTTIASSPKLYEATLSCERERFKGSGKLHIEAPSSDRVVGNTDMTMGEMHMKANFDGKWISSDCGDVKPRNRSEK